MNPISDRLAQVHEVIAKAAAKSARNASEIKLVAVSKTHPPESIREALDAGQATFGESRVQEARVKIPLLPARARWQFIGHLQKNKIRHALALGFELFHGVDSLALARDLDRIAEEEGQRPRILLEVNVAGEGSKFGFNPDALRAETDALLALGRVQVDGLMCIPPLAREAEMSRKYFAQLRELRDELARDFGMALPHLSMGMSGDFAVAVEEGATLVRVGTAIFGERSGKAARAASAGFDD